MAKTRCKWWGHRFAGDTERKWHELADGVTVAFLCRIDLYNGRLRPPSTYPASG